MSDNNHISLNHMKSGQSGKLVRIDGGQGIHQRLNSLGIREGQNIVKIGAMFMRGPVTIQAGRTRVAIGHGMAKRMIIEPD